MFSNLSNIYIYYEYICRTKLNFHSFFGGPKINFVLSLYVLAFKCLLATMDNSENSFSNPHSEILYIGAILTHDNAQNAPAAVLRRVVQSYVFTQQLSERIFDHNCLADLSPLHTQIITRRN